MILINFKSNRLCILICALLVHVASYGAPIEESPVHVQETQQAENSIYDPEKVGFAFDWNDTIAFRSWSGIKSQVQQMWAVTPNKVAVGAYAIPICVYSVALHLREKTAEEITDALIGRFSCLSKIPDIKLHLMRIINHHSVNPDVQQIIKQLKEKGYFVMLASNIDEASAELLQKLHPTLFNLFDTVFTTHKALDGATIKKPNTLYFGKVAGLAKSLKQTLKNLYFIDDKRKNITGAERTNETLKKQGLPLFTGILFKNPAQLAKDLTPYLDRDKEPQNVS